MNIQKKRIIIIGGAYGSGKSEISLNLAQRLATQGFRSVVVDLDFVNPYFRSRDWQGRLGEMVEVVSSHQGYEGADLPAISAKILAELRLGQRPLIIDLGGDPIGAKVLGSFACEPALTRAHFWLVLNPYRPFTEEPPAMVEMVRKLESAAGLKADGLIANPNLLEETKPEEVEQGLNKVQETAAALQLPIKFVTVESQLYAALKPRLEPSGVELLPLKRYLFPPWEQTIEGN